MRGAGITPEAVPRKGREDRNTGDRQRDSKGVVGWTEKSDSETGVVALTTVTDETEGSNDTDGKKRWFHGGGVCDRGVGGGKAGWYGIFVQGGARKFWAPF